MDFQAIRKEYENAGINDSDLDSNPMEQFKVWYQLAVDKCPGPWFEPNAMALATSDGAGDVTNRIVLLKHIEEIGIRFFTNYDSKKGTQLGLNPKCSIVLHWPYLGRQVRMDGAVTKTSREVSEAYFHSRPRGSQIGAAASKQSSVVNSRESLEETRGMLEEKYSDGEVPLPDNWGGYLLTPVTIEFWQGRLDRLHDRIVYQNDGSGTWNVTRLSP